MFIDKWMKMKISKLPFITFLKKHQYRYLLHCICDLAPYKFENNPRNQAPNREYCKTCYVDPIEKIGIRHGNIRTQSNFLVRTTFSPYKKYRSLALRSNEIPLYFLTPVLIQIGCIFSHASKMRGKNWPEIKSFLNWT